ncbi:MAG: hypothetical protein NVS1B10_03500 [Candidatus Saccharimonadales bacterium]
MLKPELGETFKKTVAQDVQSDAKNIKIPTLLIYGQNDDAVPVADGRHYNHLIMDSKLEVLAGSGHFVHIDKTQEVNKLITEFLK